MEIVRAAQAFDRQDVIILMHHCKRQARIDPSPVHQNGARAALAMVAPFLGAGQAKMLAQQIEQGCPDIGLGLEGLAVDSEVHGVAPPG
jgi:hypothetical protein